MTIDEFWRILREEFEKELNEKIILSNKHIMKAFDKASIQALTKYSKGKKFIDQIKVIFE
jgi:hypothetical protein